MISKPTPWDTAVHLPAARQDALHSYALDVPALHARGIVLATNKQPWERWWLFVTDDVHPTFCDQYGAHALPMPVLLKTARELKFWFEREIRDLAQYDVDNTCWEPVS